MRKLSGQFNFERRGAGINFCPNIKILDVSLGIDKYTSTVFLQQIFY